MSYLLFTSESASASETRLNLLSSGFIQVKQPNADRIYSAGDRSGPRSGVSVLLASVPSAVMEPSEAHQPHHSGLNLPVE